MRKTINTIFILTIIILSANAQKKVYADYHNLRLTRQVDGDDGLWSYAIQFTNNTTGVTQLTYNADIILANGKNNIAAVEYPLVGMQSQTDSTYLEYQILSAKAAGIDGFFVEWGYIDHSSNIVLNALLKAAKKFNFEIGVNICDAWLMNNSWITSINPAISTPDQKVQYFITCMQYLINNVYSGPTAAVVNGRPVIYLFGSGFTTDQYNTIRTATYTYPVDYIVKSGDKFPSVIRRTTLAPTLVNGVYTPLSPVSQAGTTWINTNKVIPTSWMPERLRTGSPFQTFNKYATVDDCKKYLQSFADNIWTKGYPLAAGYVSPGMNNYGCGGWSSTGALSCIPRSNGDTYKQLWAFNLTYSNFLNMIYIASWNDYTEGHEIEPTVENQDSDLITTLQYSSQFKGQTSYDITGISLPYEVFKLRKQIEFFQLCGINCVDKKSQIDVIVQRIINKDYVNANSLIIQAKADFNLLNSKIAQTSYSINSSNITITGSKNSTGEYVLSGSRTGVTINNSTLKSELANKNYEGYLNYEYWDDTWGNKTYISSGTNRLPTDSYKYIATITDEGIQQWKTAKIRLYKENVLYGALQSNSDFSFYGDVSALSKIRNVSFNFTVFTKSIDTSTGIEKNTNQILCYCKGENLYLQFKDESTNKEQVKIYSQDGRLVLSKEIYTPQAISISNLNYGFYIVSVFDGIQNYNFKLIK